MQFGPRWVASKSNEVSAGYVDPAKSGMPFGSAVRSGMTIR